MVSLAFVLDTKLELEEFPSQWGLLPWEGWGTLSFHERGSCVLRCGGQTSSLPGSTSCVLMVSSWVRGGREHGHSRDGLPSPA